jgi:hypothetical protein
MIHIATVHWQTDRWIDLQLRFIRSHLEQPYRVYAFLNDVPSGHAEKFFYVKTEPIEDHATKLNLLADLIIKRSADGDDPLIFIDGDAFPVSPVAQLLADRLGQHKLIAVKRSENNGDRQPHPCFCATTVGWWHENQGDWSRGHTWLDRGGSPVTDVGGNLLRTLTASRTHWYPLLRVNVANRHPVFFGVYGDDRYGAIVYHHGAGFRSGLSREDFSADALDFRPGLTTRAIRRLPSRRPFRRLRRRYDPVRRWKRGRLRKVQFESERLRAAMERDGEFWRALV